MPQIDTSQPRSWFRRLQDDRIEVFLRVGSHKLRASGPEEWVNSLVESFEQETGCRVDGAIWRDVPRRGPRPMDGQLDIMELQSGDKVGS